MENILDGLLAEFGMFKEIRRAYETKPESEVVRQSLSIFYKEKSCLEFLMFFRFPI